MAAYLKNDFNPSNVAFGYLGDSGLVDDVDGVFPDHPFSFVLPAGRRFDLVVFRSNDPGPGECIVPLIKVLYDNQCRGVQFFPTFGGPPPPPPLLPDEPTSPAPLPPLLPPPPPPDLPTLSAQPSAAPSGGLTLSVQPSTAPSDEPTSSAPTEQCLGDALAAVFSAPATSMITDQDPRTCAGGNPTPSTQTGAAYTYFDYSTNVNPGFSDLENTTPSPFCVRVKVDKALCMPGEESVVAAYVKGQFQPTRDVTIGHLGNSGNMPQADLQREFSFVLDPGTQYEMIVMKTDQFTPCDPIVTIFHDGDCVTSTLAFAPIFGRCGAQYLLSFGQASISRGISDQAPRTCDGGNPPPGITEQGSFEYFDYIPIVSPGFPGLVNNTPNPFCVRVQVDKSQCSTLGNVEVSVIAAYVNGQFQPADLTIGHLGNSGNMPRTDLFREFSFVLDPGIQYEILVIAPVDLDSPSCSPRVTIFHDGACATDSVRFNVKNTF